MGIRFGINLRRWLFQKIFISRNLTTPLWELNLSCKTRVLKELNLFVSYLILILLYNKIFRPRAILMHLCIHVRCLNSRLNHGIKQQEYLSISSWALFSVRLRILYTKMARKDLRNEYFIAILNLNGKIRNIRKEIKQKISSKKTPRIKHTAHTQSVIYNRNEIVFEADIYQYFGSLVHQ